MSKSPTDLMSAIAAEVKDQRYPPVDRWEPKFCGDIDMRIAADGTWFYMGTPITRAPMVKLFSSVLRKDIDGKTYLVTPVEKIGITVDDAHFLMTLADQIGTDDKPLWRLTTQVGDHILLDGDHPLRVVIDARTGEPRPYIRVRGRLDGLVSRAVFYQLVDAARLVDSDSGSEMILDSGGQSFSLGRVDA